MAFIIHQLQQFGMAAITMICALFGTVGMIKLIKIFFHVDNLPTDLLHGGRDNNPQKEGKE